MTVLTLHPPLAVHDSTTNRQTANTAQAMQTPAIAAKCKAEAASRHAKPCQDEVPQSSYNKQDAHLPLGRASLPVRNFFANVLQRLHKQLL